MDDNERIIEDLKIRVGILSNDLEFTKKHNDALCSDAIRKSEIISVQGRHLSMCREVIRSYKDDANRFYWKPISDAVYITSAIIIAVLSIRDLMQ